MLTQETPIAIREQHRSVRLDISSVVVRLALMHVVEKAGWGVCSHESCCACTTATDSMASPHRRPILVVRDVPAACQEAMEAVMSGRAQSIVLWDEPETLATVFDAINRDSYVLPRRVVELALDAPRLTSRQRTTLRLLAMGRSNQGIAVAQHQSVSTAKRDVAELFGLFDVSNRAALSSAAAALGFV